MSILLQFQFVASRLVLDFSARGRSGSHVVAVAAASAALLRRCRRHWLHYYTELLGFVSFFFESAFGSLLANICQQQMPKLELVYCGFKILFRANWQPYMVSFD